MYAVLIHKAPDVMNDDGGYDKDLSAGFLVIVSFAGKTKSYNNVGLVEKFEVNTPDHSSQSAFQFFVSEETALVIQEENGGMNLTEKISLCT
ncbi:hypothetical protein F2P79_011592 [Pimephales promelas]|nr:hypothetical protein F2P79_011592 [Pimephales promelas]